jgi:hypothetical protein
VLELAGSRSITLRISRFSTSLFAAVYWRLPLFAAQKRQEEGNIRRLKDSGEAIPPRVPAGPKPAARGHMHTVAAETAMSL